MREHHADKSRITVKLSHTAEEETALDVIIRGDGLVNVFTNRIDESSYAHQKAVQCLR